MKKIFSFVFAAMMLLVSSSAMAQSETLKGDVNADGVVDVADIAAVIKIMQEAGGAVEATKYYWYVGQSNPAEMTSIEPIVTENGVTGWRLIDTSKSYTFGNPIYTSDAYPVESNPSQRALWYVALPSDKSYSVYNVLQTDEIKQGNLVKLISKTINNVTYDIYEVAGASRKFEALIIY